MNSTPLEDGSVAYYNADGSLAYIIPPNGGKPYLADTSISGDFVKQLGSIAGAIAQAFGVNSPAAAPATPAPGSLQIPPVLMMAGLAFLAYKLLK